MIAACALIVPSSSAAVGAHHNKRHRRHKIVHHKKSHKASHKAAHRQQVHHAAARPSHGQLLKLVPHLLANTNTSNNWFGYNQGTLEQGAKLFNSITGDWTVPTATQHTSSQAESSSDWIGIGGGCVDAGCTATDSTLIQTGTEQDVSSSGSASYSAWYELVPAPSLTISMTVAPGNHMHASVAEVVPNSNTWTITLQDVTRKESFSTTVPYSSTHGTAEWIEETPLLIGTNAGFAALPNLTNPAFDLGTTNGAPVKLTPSEQMDLTDSSGKVIGAPSAPDPDADGFSACTWAGACTAPSSS
jgi:Peptidase A4 family